MGHGQHWFSALCMVGRGVFRNQVGHHGNQFTNNIIGKQIEKLHCNIQKPQLASDICLNNRTSDCWVSNLITFFGRATCLSQSGVFGGLRTLICYFPRWQWVLYQKTSGLHNYVVFTTHASTTLYPPGTHIVPLEMKGCICHFAKWQIHPLISKGTVYEWK